MDSWTNRLAGWIRPLQRALVLGLALLLAVGLAACSRHHEHEGCRPHRCGRGPHRRRRDGQRAAQERARSGAGRTNTSERQVKAGNVAAADGTLKTFQALWDTARPVVKLVAGPNDRLIDKGVKLLTTTFGGDTTPSKDNALAAITGLIKPLAALLG